MANVKCRNSDHVADVGADCRSCAADSLAKALYPFGGQR